MMLTQQRLKEVLDYDPNTGEFRWKVQQGRSVIGAVAGSIRNIPGKYRQHGGYIKICVDGRAYGAHRLAWLYMHGQWPQHVIDHMNGINTDNRICNLRDITQKDNLHNIKRHRSNKSGITGVHYHKTQQKWHAYITHNAKRIYLGVFSNKQDAIDARKAAEAVYQPLRIINN